MAKLTFIGTAKQAVAAIGTDIDVGTKVTITDNGYDAADLLAIVQATNNHPVVLEKTNSGVPLEDGAANLVEIIQGINKYTGAITVTGSTISADNLNILAKGTTGKVTAELSDTPITESLVSKLKDVSSKDAIDFAPTTTPVIGKSDLEALVTLSKKLPNTDWSGIAKFEGTASEVDAIKAALKVIDAEVEITSGQISAADANALSKATGTGLTATIKTGSVKSTLAALKDINPAADDLTFTTNDKTANASDLVALAAKFQNPAQFVLSTVTTITEDAKNVGVAGKSVTDALTLLGAPTDVKISGAIDAASAGAIAGDANSAVLTATVKPDTASNLATALTGLAGTDALTLTLTDTTVTAGDLDDLTGFTTVAINANSVKTITAAVANIADITAVYTAAAAKQINGLGNENVTITGDATASITTVNDILAATSGIVTAELTGTAAALDAALTNAKATDALALTISAGAAAAEDLLSLDNKTSVAVDAKAVTTITGTAANVKKVYAAKGITTEGDEAITLTTDSSAADVNAIAAGTSGAVTATIKAGSVAATLKALGSIDTSTDVLTFKTTDKSAKASDLFALANKFSDLTKFDASAVKTITGTASDVSDIKAILNAATGITSLANPEVKITGTISAADAGAISALTTAKVTANLAADTAAQLVLDLATAGTNDVLNITVNGGTASAANLATLDGITSQKIKVDAVDVTAANYAEFDSIYLSGKSGFSNLGDENITVTGPLNAAQAENVAKATNKKATAIISTDDASVLVANLKNAKATDAFTITLAAAPASAKDLLTLDSKTSVAIGAGAVTEITGSVADVNKVIAANTAVPATITLPAAPVYTLSGTAKAADVDAIAKTTSGIVTATIAADTAAKLNTALTDAVGTNAYTLTVNGATATATELIALRTKAGTAGTVKVDAKEISGLLADVTTVVVTNTGSQFIALGTENIKISNTVTADATNLNNILAATNGVVTATVAADTAANLVTNVAKATSKDALTLVTTNATATAAQLLALDDKTSVKVNATAIIANGITGSSAELKKLVASKGVELSGSVALTVSDAAVKAADLGAILKATTGIVTATVAADTAAKLTSALKDANSLDALTLTVNGTSAAAKDLISLTTSTNSSSVAIKLDVAAITGNINEITNVFVTSAAKFDDVTDIDATISSTIGAAQADAVATVITAGTVTATIDAGTAAYLNATLTDTDENAYKLKLTGNDATATDLLGLDSKTSVAVDASAIKNITVAAADVATGAAKVKDVYVAAGKKDISGLGNETVDLTGATDANVALVNAINNYTTGVITLPELVLKNIAPATFNLKQLGDLKGITGLEEIDANNGVKDTLNISLKDLLEANDSTTSFKLDIIGGGSSEDDTLVMGDITGWTEAKGTYTGNASTEGSGTITYTKGAQVITIDLTNVIFDI